MKLRDWIVIATAVVVVLLFAWLHHALNLEENETRVVKVGFIYEGVQGAQRPFLSSH